MRTKILVIPAILVLLTLLNCKGCSKTEPASVLHLASSSAVAALWIPNAVDLGHHLDQFIQRATKRAGAGMIRRVRAGLTAQFGFDILDLTPLEQKGLQVKKGLAMFTEGPSPQPIIAVAISDSTKFDAFFLDIVAKLDGANRVSEEQFDGFKVKTLARPFGKESVPILVWTHIRGHVLLALNDGKESLKLAAGRILEADFSLKTTGLPNDPVYAALHKKVAEGDSFVFARGGSTAKDMLEKSAAAASDGMLTSIRTRATGFSMDTFVDLKVPGLRDALGGKPTLELSKRIESDAVLMLLTRAARPDGLKAARNNKALGLILDRIVGTMSEMTAVNFEKDVLPLFRGPMTAAVHLKDLAHLPALIKQSRQGILRAMGTMLNMMHVAITAEVKDVPGLTKLLEKAKGELALRGTQIRMVKETIEGKEAIIFEPDREKPNIGWALVDGHYVYSAGAGRLRQTIAHVIGGKGTLQSELTKSVGGGLAAEPSASVVVLRTEHLAAGAMDLMNGFTKGKKSLGLSVIANQVVELVKTIGDVGLAVSGEDDGVRVVMREQLQ